MHRDLFWRPLGSGLARNFPDQIRGQETKAWEAAEGIR